MFLVYSITDRESFNYVRRAKQSLQPDIPLTLVGNKADMVHLRQVISDIKRFLFLQIKGDQFRVSVISLTKTQYHTKAVRKS